MSSKLIDRVLEGRPGALTELDELLDGHVRRRDWASANDLLDPLADAAAAGDETALRALLTVIDSQQLAHGPIRKVLLDEEQIEDAAQDTLLTVARKVDQFAGRSRFTTWLHPVAQNSARQLLRRERRHEHEGAALPELDPAVRRLSSIVATREVIVAAIASIPDEFRAVVELREVNNLSYREIAERLELEIGTVRSRLSRGRSMVRDALGA